VPLVAAQDNSDQSLLVRAAFDGDEYVTGLVAEVAPLPDRQPPGREGNGLALQEGETFAIRLKRPLPHRTGTIALWVQPNFTPADERDQVFFVIPATEGESHDNWQMQWRSDGTLLARAGKMGGSELYQAGLRFDRGQWVHLAMAWDARNLTLYVDGKRASSDLTLDFSAEPGSTLFVGSWADGGRRADVVIDELCVYDRKLSAEEIADLAGTDSGAALGSPPPANRQFARPGPPPPTDADDLEAVARLDFEKWPVRGSRLVRPRQGAPSVEQVDGKFGKGAQVTAGGLALDFGDRFPRDAGTVTVWVRPNWDGGHEESKVFFHLPTDNPDSTHNYHLQMWGGSLSARAGSMGDDRHPGATGSSNVARSWKAGEWHFIAMTWDADRFVLYVDGEPVLENTDVSYENVPGQRLTVGSWADGSRSADATLDEFRVYGRSLSAEEIRSLFERNTRQ
jgi:hypothetical protein